MFAILCTFILALSKEMCKDLYMDKYAPYKIIEYGGEGEIVEKKSRFIAHVQATATEEEAAAFIESEKKRYWDARHHCYAYILGEQGQTVRYSDDGSPPARRGNRFWRCLRRRESVA